MRGDRVRCCDRRRAQTAVERIDLNNVTPGWEIRVAPMRVDMTVHLDELLRGLHQILVAAADEIFGMLERPGMVQGQSIILIEPAIARLAIPICCRNDDDLLSLARSAGCNAAAIAQIVAGAASMRMQAEAYAAGAEGLMNRAPNADAVRSVPKNSRKRMSYNEDANEASGLVRDEAADLERETADRGNQAIERTEPDDGSDSPAFEG